MILSLICHSNTKLWNNENLVIHYNFFKYSRKNPREMFGDLSENEIYNQWKGQNLNSGVLTINLMTFPTGHNLYFKPGQTWSRDVVLPAL